jgi:two-component SAPR family response regulator
MDARLSGKRVFVIEDEYVLADDLAQALKDAGAKIVGPASEHEDTLRFIVDLPIDLAVVDINLRGKADFLIADVLAARNIPFVFATGYDAEAIPKRHAEVMLLEKPFRTSVLVEYLVPR